MITTKDKSQIKRLVDSSKISAATIITKDEVKISGLAAVFSFIKKLLSVNTSIIIIKE